MFSVQIDRVTSFEKSYEVVSLRCKHKGGCLQQKNINL